MSSTCIVYKDSVTASTSTVKGEQEEAADVGKKCE